MAHLVRSSLHDEDVLWFEVSVDDTLAVQETNPSIWGRESRNTILDKGVKHWPRTQDFHLEF